MSRYVVGSVGGWPITPATLASGKNCALKERKLWYVLDSLCCYEIVAEFRHNNHERKARELAARLNAEEEAATA